MIEGKGHRMTVNYYGDIPDIPEAAKEVIKPIQMSDYETYLRKYCKSRGFCREEAERHLIVQEVKRMYEEREKEGTKNENHKM